MRIDHQSAIRSLQRAVDMLRVAPASSADFAARLYDLTTVLFDNPICSTAVEAVLDTRGGDSDVVESCRDALVLSIRADVQRFCQGMLEVLAVSVPARTPNDLGSREHLTLWFEHKFEFGAVRTTRQQVLTELASADYVRDLSVTKLVQFRANILQDAGPLLARDNAFAPTPPAQVRRTQCEQARALVESQLARGIPALVFANDVVRQVSLRPVVERFRSVHEEMTSLLRARGEFPYPESSELARLAMGSTFTVWTKDAERLASLVEAHMTLGPIENYALRRLVSYLEHFGKDQLLDAIDAEQRAPGRKDYEAILQDHVDRFLFSEGLFPITHADASGGSIDTFVDRYEHLFKEVRETHQSPVLLELKQHLRSDEPEQIQTAVRNKVQRALEQVAIYSRHLQAKPSWQAHEVMALVAYDGPKRFSTSHAGVMLVYLGNANPSAGSSPLD